MSPDAASLIARVGADTSALAKGMASADALVRDGARNMAASAKSAGAGIGANMGAGLESGLKTVLGAAGITLGVAGIIKAGQEVFAMWSEGAQAMRVGTAFQQQFGQAVDSLNKLRAASHGAIDDVSLQLAANKAAMLGVTTNVDTLARLLEVAGVRGRAMGVGTTQAFNDLVTGLGRASPEILDNLGIVTGGAAAFEAYARSINKTAAELTGAEKTQFLVNKVLQDSGKLTNDAIGSVDLLTASWKNLREELGRTATAGTPAAGFLARGVAEIAENFRRDRELREASKPYQEIVSRQYHTTAEPDEVYLHQVQVMKDLDAQYYAGRISMEQYQAQMGAGLGITAEDISQNEVRNAVMGRVTAGLLSAREAEEYLAMLTAEASAATWAQAAASMGVVGPLNAQAAAALSAAAAQDALTASLAASVRESMAAYAAKGAYTYISGKEMVIQGPTPAELQATMGRARTGWGADLTGGGGGGGKGGGGGGKSKAQQAAEEAARDLRSAVESILQPSTARYAGGKYVDAWDEEIRRLKSAVSDPKSVWKSMLGGRGGKEAEAYAKEVEEQFYAGLQPSMINWAAFDAAYAHLLQVKAGREALVQAAMARVGGGANKAEVMAAFGLKGTPVEAGADLAGGFTVGMASAQMGKPVTEAFAKQMEGQQKTWVSLGKLSMTWFTGGLNEGISKQTARDIAKAIFPAFFELLQAREARP